MLTIYTDGGSRGNPGKSAFSFVVVKDVKIISEHAEFLGIATNNEAEYNAIIAALTKVKEKSLHIISDSELVICQLRGEYKTKQPHLQKLKQKVLDIIGDRKVTFTHSPRENKFISHADWLLNEELDRY